MISPWFQACIYWKKSVIWRHQSKPSISPLVVSLFHGSPLSDPYVKDTVFISQIFLLPSIITSGSLIWENLKDVFIWGKSLQPCCLKGVYFFHKSSWITFVWKVLCQMHERTCSQPILIWQFHNSNCSYS